MDDNQCSLRPTESLDGKIAALAASQFGVFSRLQALAVGFTARQIQFRVQRGRWEQVLPGVYRIVGVGADLHQDALAAVLWGGPGALASHAVAAALWGMDGVRRPHKSEIWVPESRSLRSPDVIAHRGERLDRADRTTLHGIPLTTAVRTLIDVAGRLDDDRLLGAMESVFRQRLGTPERLAARLDALRTSGRPGAGRLQELLAARGKEAAMESTLEAMVWSLLRREGVRLPVRQHWVSVAKGRFRLDFAWPDLKVGLECDSWRHHGGRVEFGKDRARYAELASARWRVLPVTWHACTREPERVVRWVQALVPAAA